MALRYMDWVNKRIQSAESEVNSEVFAAKKAAYLARTGDIDSAVELIDRIKSNALRKNLDFVAIYATFVDGVIAFYQDHTDQARDKWSRAKALSKAAGADSIRANSCSWLAHHSFGSFDLRGLDENLSEAFQLVTEDDSECLSRLFLVLAEALHLCGDRALANDWYLRSRGQALRLGDDATISAIMYNRAAMDIACSRQELLRNRSPVVDTRLVVLEAESTDNFDRLIGVVSLPRAFVFRFDAEDPHPIPWLRVKLSCAMGAALYPHPQWQRLAETWEQFYPREGLDQERRKLLAMLEATMPSFVALLVNHRPKTLRGNSLKEVVASVERQPTRLAALHQAWRASPEKMRAAPPTLVFAVIGQARANGQITPEAENRILSDLLTHWAALSALNINALCGSGSGSQPNRIQTKIQFSQSLHI